jgi:hypothetical protein
MKIIFRKTLDSLADRANPELRHDHHKNSDSRLGKMRMNDGSKHKHPQPLSVEEQHHEASQDDTGRLERYLRLADKMLESDERKDEDGSLPHYTPKAA